MNQLEASVQLVRDTEAKMQDKAKALRHHLHQLVDKIAVHDFELVVDGLQVHVSWATYVPPTLFTLVKEINAHLKPQPF
jgi:hypothetical protein